MVKSFITLDTVITIVTYDRKTFIVQATDLQVFYLSLEEKMFIGEYVQNINYIDWHKSVKPLPWAN